MIYRLALAVVLLTAGAARAQTVPNAADASATPHEGEVISLSPAEKQAALDAAAQRNINQTSLYAPPLSAAELVATNDGKPHGSMEMFVGSDGSRGIAGSTYFPLGNNASMAISVATGRSPYGYGGYGHGSYGYNAGSVQMNYNSLSIYGGVATPPF
jgi:hypothetical protein